MVLSVLVASAQPSFNFIVNSQIDIPWGSGIYIKAIPSEVSSFLLACFEDLVSNTVSSINLTYLSGDTLNDSLTWTAKF